MALRGHQSQLSRNTIARRCTVSGRVQGVGFRCYVQLEAEHHGVRGYVRNLPDGRVEALLEGGENDVLSVLDKVRQGPRWARVEDVEVECLERSGGYSRFEIIG